MQTKLTNNEYTTLFEKGGDELLSLFAILRYHKKGIPIYTKVGRKGVYATLNHYTGVSINTLKKYLPKLIELNYVALNSKGGIMIRGRKYTEKHLKKNKTYKLIPIKISKFVDCKDYCAFVRIHSNLKSQRKGIEKRAKRIKLLTTKVRTLKDFHDAKRLKRKGITLENLKKSSRKETALSNSKFYDLKKSISSKSNGNYFKSKLLKKNLITQNRQVFLLIAGRFTYSYLRYIRESISFGGVFLGSKGIYFEDIPSIVVK